MPERSDRFAQNLERVRSLVEIYEGLADGQGRRPVKSQDVLRAAVVFLHAALEEYIRQSIVEAWPRANKEILDGVPLAGLSTSRPEKFLLGDLVRHRGRTVDEVLETSVAGFSNVLNINNVEDLAGLLKKLGVDSTRVSTRFADLTELMKRRHHIVHQADRNDAPGSGQHGARSISVGLVSGWSDAVQEFVEAVEALR